MGHRLTRIYTRTGDSGTTGLSDGSRISKQHLRIVAMGGIDELNSHIGLLLTENVDAWREDLILIQHRLFDLGAQLSLPNRDFFAQQAALDLEQKIDTLNQNLPALKEFILPGGSRAAAQAQIVRAICRRVECLMVALHAAEPLPAAALQFINRLSDYLFVLARAINQSSGIAEPLWQNRLSGN